MKSWPYSTLRRRLKLWLEYNFEILMLCSTVLELLMLAWIAWKA